LRRILFLYSSLGVGGAERQLSLLVLSLREHGFDPIVATLRFPGRYADELREAGIRIAHANVRSRFDIRGTLRALRLSRTQPEIVVSHSIDAELIGNVVARRLQVPDIAIEQGGPGIWKHRGGHRRALLRLVAPHVTRAVAVSESQIPELEAFGYLRGSIRVIPNAAPQMRPARTRDDMRARLGLQRDDFVALLVSMLRPEKRPDRFVEAIALAHGSDARVQGIVAGAGPLLPDIRRRAQGIGPCMQVLGERSDVADLIEAADVVCLSSDVEGIPLSALEAMSLGRPVVATDVGGLRDVVIHDFTGLLVPPNSAVTFADALVGLASKPTRAREMGAAGKRRFHERYTVERMVQAYVDLFNEVARKGHR
jgi:glycosyltransferase involved in cell wall biosynthesis